MVEISLLGTGGMLPLPERFLSSVCVRINGKLILIDCGEGTQISLKKLGWGIKKLDIILITHFHADHISGLAGIILSLINSERADPIYIIGPNGLENIFNNLCVIVPELPFKIFFIEQDFSNKNILEINNIFISTLKLDHSCDCFAYSICLKRIGKFNLEKAKKIKLPCKFWSELQHGKQIEFNNKIFSPKDVLDDERTGIKITYCTDTRPIDQIVNFSEESDLFICEGTYGENNKIEKAVKNKHMTFSEAANLAKQSNCKELWLTHFSPSMPEPEKFLINAKKIFNNSKLGTDGLTKKICFN
ncbi:MAG: ribonuclease Z [Clostridiales bacterium]|jgi:ribonuclease Z|nr:ribonuclease Z [Clostridiales bacterium]